MPIKSQRVKHGKFVPVLRNLNKLDIYDAETLNFIKPKKIISIQTSDLIYKVFIKND